MSKKEVVLRQIFAGMKKLFPYWKGSLSDIRFSRVQYENANIANEVFIYKDVVVTEGEVGSHQLFGDDERVIGINVYFELVQLPTPSSKAHPIYLYDYSKPVRVFLDAEQWHPSLVKDSDMPRIFLHFPCQVDIEYDKQ